MRPWKNFCAPACRNALRRSADSLRALATDLQTGTAVVMRDTGDYACSSRKQLSARLLCPVRDPEGRLLVDGGLVANLPISYTETSAPIS